MESEMDVESLLPEAGRLMVERLRIEPTGILMELRCIDFSAQCPDCKCPSRRVHSKYPRSIDDLPWRGTPVVICWHARKFFCDNPECHRCIFAEQLPGLVARRGRNSTQLDETLVDIGLECGGEPGQRLASELGIGTSGDTILRRLRSIPAEADLHPQTIGIDDFAFRKGHRYGTVIVDHESGRVMDLLPERSSDSTADWLRTQPQVEVVTRDRSALYASGITAANPQVVQVADRFHLHVNLREAVVRMLDRHHQDVTAAAKAAANPQPPVQPQEPGQPEPALTPTAADEVNADGAPTVATDQSVPPSKEAERAMNRRAKRLARYEQILHLHQSGVGIRAIAKQMGMGRETVKKFLRAGAFPERAKTRRSRLVDRYLDELRRLWDSGIHNATELYRHIHAQGFRGSSFAVRRCIASWRDPAQQGHVSGCRPKSRGSQITPIRISSNRLSWLLMKEDIERDASEQKLIDQLLASCDPLRIGIDLAKGFKPALANHQPQDLWSWTQRTIQDGVPMEIRSFAEGLVRDATSVEAAVKLQWNNGRAEGHVNRIKLIKRKMYGRAKFDLLRIRVLAGS
jgi:transposase